MRFRSPIAAVAAFAVVAVVAVLCAPQASAQQTLRPPAVRLEYHRAERAWRSGASLAEAKARLDRVLDALPQDGEAYLMRARVLLDLHRAQEAARDARIAVAHRPDDGEAWLALAEAGAEAGETAEATAALNHAATLITDGAERHLRLSRVAQALGEIDRSEAFARIALALDPERSAPYMRLAEVFMAQSRADDARSILQRGLAGEVFTPSDVQRHPLLGGLFGDAASVDHGSTGE